MFVEYAGLTHEAAVLVERFRQSPNETKSDILVRVLTTLGDQKHHRHDGGLDLGQGVVIPEGEHLLLFLSEKTKRARRPDATAVVRNKSLFLYDEKVEPSKGNPLQPAMRKVQERLNHRNAKGEIISLSAWRQWHVLRDGRLMQLLELKDPNLARKRGREVLELKDLM